MNAIQLSYCTFGLTQLGFLDALTEVDKAGYPGVEISFHRDQFNPFNLTDDDLARVKQHLGKLRVQPACVATASHFFDPFRPHEPSLMAVEKAARQRRIDLVKQGIRVARQLGTGLVTFGSGFIRDEHVNNPQVDPSALLVDSIRECLKEIRADEDITLLIEPEPGMHIETLAQGLALLKQVDSPKFKLHIDICHAYCSEPDYVQVLKQAASEARYLHISDAQPGYNLKVVHDQPDFRPDMQFANWLVHFPDTADFLLLDREHPVHFPVQPPTAARQQRVTALLELAGIERPLQTIGYDSLYAGESPLDDEIFTWMISVPGLSYDVLERTRPIVGWLRGARSPRLVEHRVANTLTGVVHFHEIPGEGSLDFEASFRSLVDGGFRGFGSVELYHHVASWKQALDDSYRHLAPFAART